MPRVLRELHHLHCGHSSERGPVPGTGQPAQAQAATPPAEPQPLRVARLILGRRQLAEDAVQEAYIRAARGVHGVRDPEALAAWFRRIVAHEALRLVRL